MHRYTIALGVIVIIIMIIILNIIIFFSSKNMQLIKDLDKKSWYIVMNNLYLKNLFLVAYCVSWSILYLFAK